jgi:enterochelin esterase-like enzyme
MYMCMTTLQTANKNTPDTKVTTTCRISRGIRIKLKGIVPIILALLICSYAGAQNVYNHAPKGFDSVRANIPHGKVDTIYYYSKTVGVKRRALVYTPPGFSSKKKYPVLYLLHGLAGTEKEWVSNAPPQIILDNLYSEKKAEPMIVVMPNGRAMVDDRAIGDKFDSARVKSFATFEHDLLDDLIPFIEKSYPVYKELRYRAIAGLSMGGGQALNFGLGNVDKFAYVGGFAPAPNTKKPEVLIPDPEKIRRLKLLWISCAVDDYLIWISNGTHEFLVSHRVPHIYYTEPGGHDFTVWRNDLYIFAQLLFKETPQSVYDELNKPFVKP